MKKPLQIPVKVDDAPQAIGPYSQAQYVDSYQEYLGGKAPGEFRTVWTSGQIALDPATGQLVEGGVAAQTERVLKNLAAVLAGAGFTLGHAVKTTVYLADMQDFQAMNEVYARHFPTPPPARTTIAAAGLPRGARVEIDVIAVGRPA
jgi:2-iminobutanoate/2-iminopropanoate deaminase